MKVAAQLRERGIRVEVDTSDDRMQKKIRNAQRQKVPYMLLAGDEDVAKGAVSFRFRDGGQRNGVPVADADVDVGVDGGITAAADLGDATGDVGSRQVVEEHAVGDLSPQSQHRLPHAPRMIWGVRSPISTPRRKLRTWK